MYVYPAIGCKRITLLGTKRGVDIGPQSERYSIQIVNNDEIICCVHLPSKLHGGKQRRRLVITSLIDDIRNLEITLNTDKTIIVGDFNENPYEDDFVNVDGLFAVSSYAEAQKRVKIVEGKEFVMFYNPMWNLFGDFTEPYGTYFYNGDGEGWNIFDQVIISPSLRKRFVDNQLKIITETLSKNLLKFNGRPDTQYSDHLPITFELED
jgi:exonuclease III